MTAYRRHIFSLPVKLEEPFSAVLWAAGTLGLTLRPAAGRRLTVEAYFPPSWSPEEPTFDLSSWQRQGVCWEEDAPCADQDWLAGYRAAALPFDIGDRFRIDPRDAEVSAPGSRCEERRFRLRIPAQTAFGTGSHASTRLALLFLERLDLGGGAVLDVGTGSGILAFAALCLGAQQVVAFDLDAQSMCIAATNAGLNQLRPQLFAGRLAALSHRARFDLILVNILPERIRDELASLAALLHPDARVVSSGNLWTQRQQVLERWAAVGLRPVGEARDEEWAAWLLAP